jgi:myo-inositol 2-dehydrogenase/D-chiro-inositol 1-dehydrogenase
MARYVTGSEVADVHARGAIRIDTAIGEAGDVDTAAVTLEHENAVASENPRAHTTVRRTAEGTRAPPAAFLPRALHTPSYVHAWEAFVAAVQSGQQAPVDGRDGRAGLAIALAAQRSRHEGRTVRVAEIG